MSAARPEWFWPVVIGSAFLVLSGIGLGLWWLLVYRKRQQESQPLQPARGIESKRLTTIWENFLANLPSTARSAVPAYAHFLVLGAAGTGKSTLIQRKVDWQGQASQFLPSYTADPLLQIYLGGKTVVQELAPPLLDSTSRATNEALTRLFRRLDIDHPPTVVLVLKVSALTLSTPDQLRQQAQLMRGKINLLSQSFGAPIPTRICLTNMDRTPGYGDVARFLKRNKVQLELPLGADAGLLQSLQSYEKYLPRALTTLPVAAFQSNVEFLLSADDILGPVRSFVQALLEGSLAAARPELQKLYFFSPAPEEQVGNPFDLPMERPEQLRHITWLRRWLHQLGIQPLHAAIGAALLLLGLGALGVVTRRHAALVQSAADATAFFDGAVRRAQEARSAPSESEGVRRGERQATEAITAVKDAESRFRPLRWLFRSEKTAIRQRFVEAVREGYLLPELDRAVRQRSRERILYTLVAIYATRYNTLGALLRAQPAEWSRVTDVSSDILLDYVQASEEPYRELALRLLPQLPSEASRYPVNDLRPWHEFVRAVLRALPLPYLSAAQLREMQQEAERLLEALAVVRKASALRQIFNALSEESPLEMVRLFGRDAGALIPHPWIVDDAEPMERLLTLVRDSSLKWGSAGHMSLFGLLKWINELGGGTLPKSGDVKTDSAEFEDELYHLPFPDEQPSEVSRRAWLELLLRSRKRLLLAYQVSAVASGHRHRTDDSEQAGSCEIPKKKKKRSRAAFCPAAFDSPPAHDSRSKLPLWSQDEFTPKLAALMSSDDTPSDGLDPLYNRPVFEREVLPLLHELKNALSNSKNLTPEEKLRLSRLVQDEVGGYSHRYCAALRRFYLSYHFHAGGASDIHTELLRLTSPGSPFLSHLRTVADNVKLAGLEEPLLHTLAQCLAELRPVAAVIDPEIASEATPAAPGAAPGGAAKNEPATHRPPSSSFPEGLKPYKDAVSKLVSELDQGPSPSAGGDKPSPLGERLSPMGKSALAAAEGRSDTPLRLAERFLDDSGIGGELRQPFLSPFQAAYRQGESDIEKAMEQHWRDELLPQVSNLFSLFPFNRAEKREVAPADLEVLSEAKGPFWQDLKTFYAPVLSEHGGTYEKKPAAATLNLDLPHDMLPTVNRLARLGRALFRSDGSRRPLKLAIRGLPGGAVEQARATQGTTAFLQVGKAAAYGFNQQPEATPMSVDWWDQGVASVGMESTTSLTGRRQTQSIEIADSAWSLFRLLQRSTLGGDGISTWHLSGEGPAESQNLRFSIEPDPWSLFQVQLP